MNVLDILLNSDINYYSDYAERRGNIFKDILYNHLKRYIKFHNYEVMPAVIFDFFIDEDTDISSNERCVAYKYKNNLDACYWNYFINIYEQLYHIIENDKSFTGMNLFSDSLFLTKKKAFQVLGYEITSKYIVINKSDHGQNVYNNLEALKFDYNNEQCLIDAARTLIDNENYKFNLDEIIKQKHASHQMNQYIKIIISYKLVEESWFDLLKEMTM